MLLAVIDIVAEDAYLTLIEEQVELLKRWNTTGCSLCHRFLNNVVGFWHLAEVSLDNSHLAQIHHLVIEV